MRTKKEHTPVSDITMTLSRIELALLGGLPLHTLEQLIASARAPLYARPPSPGVACYTLHEAVMLATGVLLHDRYGLSWPVLHQALALNPDLFVDPLDAADGATGPDERWLALTHAPPLASVGRWAELARPDPAQPVFLVSLSEAIRLVRARAGELGLVLPGVGRWGAALEAYLAEVRAQLEGEPVPWAEAA